MVNAAAVPAGVTRTDTPRDVRTVRRLTAAGLIVLAPLVVGLLRAVVPINKTSSTVSGAEALRTVGQNLGAEKLTLALGVLCVVLLPLAMVGLMRLVSRRTPVLGLVGGSMALVGWAIVPFLVAADALALEMVADPSNATAMAGLWDRFHSNPAMIALGVIFAVGHVLGMFLLGLGLWRGGVIPAWAGAAVIVGNFLHPVGVTIPSRAVEIAAFALLVVGLLPAAAAVIRMTDDEWDLPPVTGG